MAEIVEARKVPLEADAAWEILNRGSKVLVAKGKAKVLEFDPQQDDREAILKVALGRSGKLRAPTLQVGDVFLVGYNETLYSKAYLGDGD